MSVSIWTTLLKSDTKTEIYVPLDLDFEVSLEQFYEAFKRKLAENRIDADAFIDEAFWDDGKVSQKRIVVQYKGSDAANTNNIQKFLVGLDTMGNFTYVEEKVFLSCPKLPKYPKSRDNIPSKHTVVKPSLKQVVIGVGAGILGFATISSVSFFGVVCLGIAAVCIGLYVKGQNNYSQAESNYQDNLSKAQRNNKEADAEQKAWDGAWNNWRDNVLKTASLSSTNDIFGRFTRALSSSVKLTIKELFEDKKAELKDRKEKEYSEQQIEEQLAKKKAEFM